MDWKSTVPISVVDPDVPVGFEIPEAMTLEDLYQAFAARFRDENQAQGEEKVTDTTVLTAILPIVEKYHFTGLGS